MLIIIGVMLLCLILNTLALAFWCRHRGGEWQPGRAVSRQARSFKTSLCHFQINPEQRWLVVRYRDGRARTVPLDDIRRVVYSFDERWGLFSEFMTGFDIFDLLPQYRDRVETHTLSLKLQDGEEVPLYAVGQLQPREFWMTWFIELQQQLLERVGLYQRARERLQEVADKLIDNLAWANCKVVLAGR